MADTSGESSNQNLQLLRVNHSIKMVEAFESMFLSESLCDISICCGGQVVKAHRVILAASSAYFKQILSSINGQTQYPIIFVNGIQMSDLTAVLEFMYRGEVTIPNKQLPSLIKSAEILGVSGLCQLDPNSQNLNDTHDKSRTSSPTDSTNAGGPARRGRKRKKILQKPVNEVGSDAEVPTKKADECDESEDLDSSETKAPTGRPEKLAKSKLRSWTQQIAFKANHKDSDDSALNMNDDNEQPLSQLTDESNHSETKIQTNETAGSPMKKHMLKHSRARRVPLKYSEYTLPKGINDVKQQLVDKNETPKHMDTDGEMTIVDSTGPLGAKPPSPRLTRGRSRVHSSDDPKVITPSKDDMPIEPLSVASTSADGLLTPNTRSRKQTFSPSDANRQSKDNNTESVTTPETPIVENKVAVIKSEDESSQHSQSSTAQSRTKSPVKPQISTLPSSSSLIKWRPKDPQTATTKFTTKARTAQDSPEPQLNYQYESIQADGPPVYRCSYCRHCFRSKQNINDHIRSVHLKTEDRYVCPICHKQFKWKTSLNNHFNQLHPLSRPTPLRHFDKSRKSLP